MTNTGQKIGKGKSHQPNVKGAKKSPDVAAGLRKGKKKKGY